jgi:neuralized-like protein 4
MLRVSRTWRVLQGELVFYINGVSQGVAADNLPARIFGVVDLYGKCAQVTIVDSEVCAPDSEREHSEVFVL